jgi:hypothetical protein
VSLTRVSIFASALLLATASAGATAVDLAVDEDAVRIDGAEWYDEFGTRAASCDVNGDGIDDVVIGAPDADGPDNLRPAAGEAYIVHGRRGRWTGPLSITEIVDVWLTGAARFHLLGRDLECSDLDGDGFGEALLSAPNARGPAGDRQTAGQVHVVWGGPALPTYVDLALDPGLLIYGRTGDQVGSPPITGDVNGDGRGDLILDASRQDSVDGELPAIGWTYIVFGREQWPESLDMATDADVTIRGRDAYDALGNDHLVHDVDRDGLGDLVTAAYFGSGPENSRQYAGEVHLFLGQEEWPEVIDLAVDESDGYLFGPDPDDRLSATEGLAVGDLDLDGVPELLIGTRHADGELNDTPKAGEALVWEVNALPHAPVDLRFERDAVIYGIDEDDAYCVFLQVGDVNGDGTDDVVCSGLTDGPDNGRSEAGEAAVIHGPMAFPSSLSFATDRDLIVYGAYPGDNLVVNTLGDINGDGLLDLVASVWAHDTSLPAIWLVSPYDVDGDGITQLPDNCPLVFNPDQLDGDGDLRGDACADDWDGDGQVDEDDCAPADAAAGTPGAVEELWVAGGAATVVEWTPATFADRYDVSRGLCSEVGSTDYGACQTDRDPDPTDTRFEDDEWPPPGDGFFYLVRGRSDACATGGTWGRRSDGTGRVNDDPAGCP